MGIRNEVIYQVYVRNHTEEGTFLALIDDLKRIKDLGVDIVYLLPIHPIGEVDRKGTAGSPYAIKDFRAINPELGTLADFQLLIDAVHNLDMRLMIDVVYNHTSPDSVLMEEHPEWFYKTKDGKFGNKVGDWWDIKDLEYKGNQPLREYLWDTLEYWADMGVDGYRCDVASLVPIDFWVEARKRINGKKPGFTWLAESVDLDFSKYMRDLNFVIETDHELYQAFDMEYQYDFWAEVRGYMLKNRTLKELTNALHYQSIIYPKNWDKIRYFENHDNARFMSYGLDPIMWHAALFFMQGSTFIFGGQEFLDDHLPSLFDKDTIDRSKGDIQEYLKKLIALKHDDIFSKGTYFVTSISDCMIARYIYNDRELVGIFNFEHETISIASDSEETFFGSLDNQISDGKYLNLLTGKEVEIKNQLLTFKEPIIFEL